jgi:hypothetical protein
MQERQYFTFLKSYADIYQQLNDEQKVLFIDAIIDQQMNGVDAESIIFEDAMLNIAWSGVKPSLSKSIAQYHNGKKAKTKPTGSQVEAKPEQIRSKKKEIRNKNKEIRKRIVKEKTTIDNFYPNETSLKAVEDVYPNCNIDNLVKDFKDQARNRKQPFKDFDAGFRNYLKRGWISPFNEKKQLSHSQMASEMMKNPLLTFGDDDEL